MYYIGIDGSGIYARLIGVDENRRIIGRHSGASVTMANQRPNEVKDNIRKLLREFSRLTNTTLENCAGICLGVPDGRLTTVVEAYEGIFSELEIEVPVKITGDIELILASATREGFGTVIVSGIESAGYAFDRHKKFHKCGGWSHLFCEGGSGFAIGMQAIKCSLMAGEGLIEKTLLEKKVAEYFGISEIHEVLDYINSEKFSRAKVAELSLVVKYASSKNDPCAKMIEKQAAGDLALMAKSLIKSHKISEGKVVLSGTTILLNENIKDAFTQYLMEDFPGMEIITQTEKSEMGAVYLLMDGLAL